MEKPTFDHLQPAEAAPPLPESEQKNGSAAELRESRMEGLSREDTNTLTFNPQRGCCHGTQAINL